MNEILYFINILIKFFFLLTPFFALSAFLSMSVNMSEAKRKRLALNVTASVCVVCLILFLFGNYIFLLFGITVDAFRIGAGALLFLTSVSLVKGGTEDLSPGKNDDIVVVPLSIPIIAGPATIGTILVMSAETAGIYRKVTAMAALFSAVIIVGI
ncbi:MAG: MarC family protein, partial [Spirochaetota bacterium]